KRVSNQTFEQTLRKPVYAGRIIVPVWHIDVVGRHEPIVSQEAFDKVQMILDGRRPKITPHVRNNEDFPLRQFVCCGNCGDPLTGSWSRSKTKKRYGYYHCQDGCTRVPRQTLESQFIDLLNQLNPKP